MKQGSGETRRENDGACVSRIAAWTTWTPQPANPARLRAARASGPVRRSIRIVASAGLFACAVTAAVYMVLSSQPGGSAPLNSTPSVLMISVDWVQPIGLAAPEAARCRIAVAPFG